jgi:UDPglucose 6-dehydrogenase
MKIGFIGQGFVGKNIADDFAVRGHEVVRYALEPEYVGNKDLIQTCDIVFIAVPTPTTPQGFDYHIVQDSLALVGEGKIAILKSTLLPGTTKKLQEENKNITVLFSPEFLCESTAAHDAAHPIFNIIGLSTSSPEQKIAADMVMSILPKTEHSFIITAEAAELFKYTHNIHGYMRVVLSNLLYDVADTIDVDWTSIEQIMNVDPMMSPYYNSPVHKSGRGAGGHCFIKDMAAFRRFFDGIQFNDELGIKIFKSLEEKNIELLALTQKDQELVKGVYGKECN